LKLQFRISLFILITIWVWGIFIAFFIPYENNLTYFFPFIDGMYSTVCHQQSAKLIEYNGYHTFVCARCTGIYFGGFLSSFILLFVSILNLKNAKLIIAGSIPMFIDVVLYSSGLYDYNKTIAFITGLLWFYWNCLYLQRFNIIT